MIIGCRARGGSISETTAFVKCSRSAVVNVYNNWKNQESAQSRRANCGAIRAINDRGPLIPVECTLNSCAYLSIVADQENPYMATVYPANDGVFQQDNVTCHVPKIVRAWFEEHDEVFQLLPWLPNSPDLNHCENLWDHLDRHIKQKDPLPRNLHELHDALLFSWSQMLVATFQTHIESMTRLLTAVLAAREGYSGYYIDDHNNVT
ncbi:hypothetical protein AVEN_210173-1 [Araneus ventricosus]|uniref:Tc1-like transposase DDE domain-containing protein n=1 Tax=Araneus ventricosus TaxID=182803 RepID=A0A4Y2MCV3_ARAVE|nr:hypothetical protein AVEN_210173-1 [Araneus ventricosus]